MIKVGPMKLYVRTFGCQMNVHDSNRIVEMMQGEGYQSTTDVKEADLVVINTCSIREKAHHKGISEIGRLCKRVKRNKPDCVMVVAGCVSEQEGARIFKLAPQVDLVVGPDQIAQLPRWVRDARQDGRIAMTGFDRGTRADFLSTADRATPRGVSEFLTVSKGCEERCTYCIVPSVRGPERFRHPDDIIEEAVLLTENGVQELVLLGQKVNAYHYDGLTFAGLLERLDQLPGLQRLRFTSPHPRHMSPSLIESFGRLRTLCESIHLPVQSGADGTLARMGRRYTAGDYREVIGGLRRACPEILISTDLIVGFPGETEAEFEQTIGLLEEVRFCGAFSFKFSPRPGTAAANLPDDVTEADKARRLEIVHNVIERVEREIRHDLVGKRFEVLVTGSGRNAGQLTGRARNNQIINFQPAKGATLNQAPGSLHQVEVTGVMPHSLEGIPVADEAQSG